MNKIEYPFTVCTLPQSDGSGYLIEVPDLPGCMSDGDTLEEAIANGNNAMACWISAAKEIGREIPNPVEPRTDEWVQRVPRSLHSRLAARAKNEGVSLNTLVVSMISESLGKRDPDHQHQRH